MKSFLSGRKLSFLGIILFSLLLFSCSKKKLHQHKEWRKFFENNNVEGCVMWHNYYDGTFDVYGFGEVQERILPAETFDIVIALAGLETGVIKDTNMVITDSAVDEHLKGITMSEAFRKNITPYFQWVTTKIGKSRMAYWLDSTYYGNKEIGPDITDFWFDNTLKISPDEQMGLLEKLFQGRLAYQQRTKKLVKELLIKKISHTDTLYYQQGVGIQKDSSKTGWLAGWLKQKDEPYFFVIKTRTADNSVSNLNERSLNILYKILNIKGFVDESGHLK